MQENNWKNSEEVRRVTSVMCWDITSLKDEVHEAEQRIQGRDFKTPTLLEKYVIPCVDPRKPKGVLLSCTHQYEKAYQNMACGYSFLTVPAWDCLLLIFFLVGGQGSCFVPARQIRPGAHTWNSPRLSLPTQMGDACGGPCTPCWGSCSIPPKRETTWSSLVSSHLGSILLSNALCITSEISRYD